MNAPDRAAVDAIVIGAGPNGLVVTVEDLGLLAGTDEDARGGARPCRNRDSRR